MLPSVFFWLCCVSTIYASLRRGHYGLFSNIQFLFQVVLLWILQLGFFKFCSSDQKAMKWCPFMCFLIYGEVCKKSDEIHEWFGYVFVLSCWKQCCGGTCVWKWPHPMGAKKAMMHDVCSDDAWQQVCECYQKCMTVAVETCMSTTSTIHFQAHP